MMANLLPWEEALARVLELAQPFGYEAVALDVACGRAIAKQCIAKVNSPRFDNSAVDGFALGSFEGGASRFELVGESFAGSEVGSCEVRAGQAVRVLTGAPVPAGADRVVMQEDCSVNEGSVSCKDLGRPGQHIRRAGEDFEIGAVFLESGRILNPSSLGLLASGGVDTVQIYCLPRVGLLTTGNEVKSLGKELESGEIFNSNGVALSSALTTMGAEELRYEHVGDDFNQTVKMLRDLLEWSDVVITVGGLADGERDHILGALKAVGGYEVFSRVAMKPGKPFSMVRVNDKVVFCLPGNPVSALVTGFVFVRPFLAASMGLLGECDWIGMPSGEVIKKKAGRVEFVPGWVQDGAFYTNQFRGSHMLMALASATHLGLFPSDQTQLEIGEEIQVMAFDWSLK
ncbi:MAG: molybdopterin molybdotransferase MoeA [Fimbriimonadaceae bacterium]|nr:molybdopterin molybdotransferase MoeA [Fimbriimonadaceae bacterium]